MGRISRKIQHNNGNHKPNQDGQYRIPGHNIQKICKWHDTLLFHLVSPFSNNHRMNTESPCACLLSQLISVSPVTRTDLDSFHRNTKKTLSLFVSIGIKPRFSYVVGTEFNRLLWSNIHTTRDIEWSNLTLFFALSKYFKYLINFSMRFINTNPKPLWNSYQWKWPNRQYPGNICTQK